MVLKSNNSFSVGKKNNLAPANVNGKCGFASKTKNESNKLIILQVIKGVFPGETWYCAVRTGSFLKTFCSSLHAENISHILSHSKVNKLFINLLGLQLHEADEVTGSERDPDS